MYCVYEFLSQCFFIILFLLSNPNLLCNQFCRFSYDLGNNFIDIIEIKESEKLSKRSSQASDKQYPNETIEERESRLENGGLKMLWHTKEIMKLRPSKIIL